MQLSSMFSKGYGVSWLSGVLMNTAHSHTKVRIIAVVNVTLRQTTNCTSYCYMLVASLISGDVLVLEPESLVTRRKIKQQEVNTASDFMHCASVSVNGTILVMKESDSTFGSWELSTGSYLQHFDSHPLQLGKICLMALSDNGDQVATAHMPHVVGNRGVVVTWDVAKGCIKEVFQAYKSLPTDLVFSPSGAFLVCSDEGGECTEFCLSGARFMTRNITTREHEPSTMSAVAWKPSSNSYICGHANGSVITVESAGSDWSPTELAGVDHGLLHVGIGTPVAKVSNYSFHQTGDNINSLAMSSDGIQLAASGGRLFTELHYTNTHMVGFVAIYEPSSKKGNGGLRWKRWIEAGQDGSVLCVSFSLDCKTLASGSIDGCCHLWNVMDGSNIHKIRLSCSVTSLSFVFDIEEQQNRRLAVAMGGHERLGSESNLSVLPDDLLNKILKLT
jgi:WD40 repeat protein